MHSSSDSDNVTAFSAASKIMRTITSCYYVDKWSFAKWKRVTAYHLVSRPDVFFADEETMVGTILWRLRRKSVLAFGCLVPQTFE